MKKKAIKVPIPEALWAKLSLIAAVNGKDAGELLAAILNESLESSYFKTPYELARGDFTLKDVIEHFKAEARLVRNSKVSNVRSRGSGWQPQPAQIRHADLVRRKREYEAKRGIERVRPTNV